MIVKVDSITRNSRTRLQHIPRRQRMASYYSMQNGATAEFEKLNHVASRLENPKDGNLCGSKSRPSAPGSQVQVICQKRSPGLPIGLNRITLSL